MDTLLDGVETSAEYVMVSSYGGYTTNLPLADVTDGKAWPESRAWSFFELGLRPFNRDARQDIAQSASRCAGDLRRYGPR